MKSLAHPDGDITGVSLLDPDLDGKRQDILMDAVPGGSLDGNAGGPTMKAPAHL